MRTARPPERLLDDLASLHVPGAVVAERGSTYLVFATPERSRYTSGRAVALTVVAAIAVLVLTAFWVPLVALLPLVALPLLPLLLDDKPMLGVGAVPDLGGATLTVHGRAWGELAAAIDAYLANLPEPLTPPAEADLEPAGEPVLAAAEAVGAAPSGPSAA